jgi:hypothetical protein
LKNRLPSVLLATKSVATVVNRPATVTVAAMKSASLVRNVHRVKNAHHAKPAKKLQQSPRNALRVKSAHHAPLVKNVLRAVKNVHHAPRVKIASHVASVKNALFVNCASLWMQLQPLLLPLKSVQLASHVKNVLHAHRVKNVSHVPSKPLPPLLKKS